MIHELTFSHSPTIPKASGQHSRYWKSLLGPITTLKWTIIPNLFLKRGMFFSNDILFKINAWRLHLKLDKYLNLTRNLPYFIV